jgi:hypothetical protein
MGGLATQGAMRSGLDLPSEAAEIFQRVREKMRHWAEPLGEMPMRTRTA